MAEGLSTGEPLPDAVSALLRAWTDGDQRALARLTPIVYDELHRLAHYYLKREQAGHSLQTTALVNEAYMRLVDYKRMQWQNRAHFMAAAAQAMRHRKPQAASRGRTRWLMLDRVQSQASTWSIFGPSWPSSVPGSQPDSGRRIQFPDEALRRDELTEHQSSTLRFRREVEDRFGVLPNFFCSADAAPGLVEELWKFAKSAYLDSPLPALFKERLFVHLSRFCEIRYCIVRHVGFLIGQGRPAGDADAAPETIDDVVELLRRPLPGGSGARDDPRAP